MPNYLDQRGVQTLWQKIKDYNGHIYVFNSESDIESALKPASNKDYKVGDILLVGGGTNTGKAFFIKEIYLTNSGKWGYYNVIRVNGLSESVTVGGSTYSGISEAIAAMAPILDDVASTADTNATAITNLGLSYSANGSNGTVTLVRDGTGSPSVNIDTGTSSKYGIVKPGATGSGSAVQAASALTSKKIVFGNGSGTVTTTNGDTNASVGIATTLGSDDTTVPTSSAVQTAITNTVNAKVTTYVATTSGNSQLNSNADTIVLTSDITKPSGETSSAQSVDLDDLKVGDVILILETDVPDRWVSLLGPEDNLTHARQNVVLSKLETQKIDLSPYALKEDLADVNYEGAVNKTITTLTTDSEGTIEITSGNIKLGNITHEGKLDNTAGAIAANDVIVVAGSNGTVKRTSVAFNGSTTNKFLSQKGTWEQIDASAYIEKSNLTAAGDIIYASAANTPTHLAIGSDPSTVDANTNQKTTPVLSVSSGAPSWDSFSPITDTWLNSNLN